MSPLPALFGARSRKIGASLASALFRLLEEEEGEDGSGGKRRRGPEPELAALAMAKWAEAASGAAGELVCLRSELSGLSLALLAKAEDPGDRELFLGAAAALAELAAGADAGAAAGFLATAERASAASLALLRGRIGGGRLYSARGGSVLAYVSEPLAAAAEAALSAEPGLFDTLGPGEASSIAPPSSLAVDRPLDFVLPHFFMPPTFPAAPAQAGAPPPPEAVASWDLVESGAAPRPASIWFAGSVGDPKLGLSVAFECPGPQGGPERQAYAAKLLPLLQQGWARASQRLAKLAPAGSAPRFGLIAAAPESFLRGGLRASGEIRVGSGGFPIAAWLSPRLVSALAAALKPRPETPGPGGSLAELVAANEALLGRWAPGHRDAFLRPRPVAGKAAAAPPLAYLLAALGRRDAALAVQNCLIPRFGSQELAYLFYFHAPFLKNGKRAMRPYPFVPFSEGEVTRLLPETSREEWAHERRYDLPRRTVPAADCVAANEEAARLLWEASRAGRIELSPASVDLLEEKVGAPLAAASKAKLEALATKDIPFGYLATLERRDAARIVDRLSNRDLALACVGDKKHVELLHSAMGSGRRRDFDEELEIAEQRIERGEAGVEAAAAMKIELLGKMKEYAEDLKRERAALASGPEPVRAEPPSGAKRGAGPAPRPAARRG